MVELWIEDKLVDLSGDEDIAIDYSIAKIGEIDKRSGGLSIEFKLPKTANNRAIFENPENVNGSAKKIRKKLPAKLLTDGISQNISLSFIESTDENYNIRLFDNYADIFATIKALKCSELDLHEYDHFWTFDNVVDYRDNTDMFLYPIIDYFSDSPNSQFNNTDRKVNPKILFPAVKYEDVIEKIINAQGYSLVNLNTSIEGYPTNGLIIPYVGERNPRRNTDAKRFDGTWNVQTQTITGAGIYLNVLFDTGVSTHGYNFYNSNNLWSNAVQKFSDTFECNLDITLTVTNTVNASNNFFLFTNLDNDLILLDPLETKTITVSGRYVFLYDTNTASSVPDLEDMFIKISCLNDIDIVSGEIRISNSVITEISDTQYETDIVSGLQTRNYITVSTILPDISQGELLKQYLILTCSLLSIDEITKTVSIIPFNDLEKNISNVLDWSNKLDLSKEPIHTYIPEKYSREIMLSYSEDSSVVKPIGTDYSFNIYDENLEAEQTKIELKYAATQSNERLIGIFVPNIKMVENSTGDFSGAVMRILALKFYDSADFADTSDLEYYDFAQSTTVNTNIPIPYFIKDEETFNLGFGDNMYLYYRALISVLSNYQNVECLIRLSAKDINQLDFTKPVFIKHFNAYFYISQIKAYTPTNNESTMVELVKLF